MSMLGVTFQAVSKVIVAVLVGAFCCGSIPNATTTMRDFSFLISNVLLPALTVTNTASSVDLEMLIRCSILLLFGVCVVLIGIGSAAVMSRFMFGVDKAKTGIPAELAGDVRLDLFFDDTADEVSTTAPASAGNGARAAAADAAAKKKAATKKKKNKSSGTPYVAVILSKKLRDMGVDGHEIVAEIEVPSADVEEFPFYHWGAWVGCSIQNTVTLPLSLLKNICESVDWLDFSLGTAYIFVYSIVASLYIWACGPLYVETAQKQTTKRRLIREIIMRHKGMIGKSDAVTQTEISYTMSHDALGGGGLRENVNPPRRLAASPTGRCGARRGGAQTAGPLRDGEEASPLPVEVAAASVSFADGGAAASRFTSPPADPEHIDIGEQTEYQVWSPTTARHFSFPEIGCAEQIPYDWESTGYIRVRYADQLKDAKGPSALAKVVSSLKQLGLRLVQNIPFMSIIVGMFIGIIPPLRGLFFDGGALEMITDAVTLVGQGNIPAALLLLGANLVGSSSQTFAGGPENRRMRDFEQNTDFPLVPADDAELLGDAGKYAEWYNISHEDIEFDEHASFSLQTILQQQAKDRIAAARAAVGDGEVDGGERKSRTKQGSPATDGAATTKDLVAAAVAAGGEPGDHGGYDAPDDDEKKKDEGVLAGMNRALSLDGVKKRFVWGVIVVRLILTPAVSFLFLIALIKTMPFLFGGKGTLDRTLLAVLFIEAAAPTAINSALLFNQREYMTYPWAKMLFFQYILCTITMVMWATVGLEYVASYT